MLKAVIFDFDGVVADSELLHYKGLNEAFGLYGVIIPQDVYYERYLGYSDLECIEVVNIDYNMGADAAGIAKMIAYKTEVFDKLVKEETAIIEGVIEFVEMLRNNAIPMAVCSGGTSSDIAQMLEGSGLVNVFDPIISADHVEKSKPHPDGYVLTLKRLNQNRNNPVLPSECVVIEDSHWGLEAAGAAGMHRIGVTNTYDSEHLGPFAEKVVGRLDEITMDCLEGLCKGI